MIDPGAPYRIAITTMGPVAQRTVGSMRYGRVAAVFDRSFYIESDDSYVCIGVAALVPGPLTASVDVPGGMNWASSGIRVDARASAIGGVLAVGSRFRFDTRPASRWSPPPFPDQTSFSVSVDAVLSGARANAPMDGLAPLAFGDGEPGSLSPVAGTALPAHRLMSGWLRQVAVGIDAPLPEESVCRLLGLGPGLTPSGDDYLGGMMIALHAFGCREAVNRLFAVIDREAPRRTNRISGAHLAAARQGWGAAPLHEILNRLVTETDVPVSSLIHAVDRIGHTSGWDALTGILTAVQAWSELGRESSRAA